MKKFLLLILTLSCVFCLFSCLVAPGGGGGGSDIKNDGVVYSADVTVAIVQSADADEYVSAHAAAMRAKLIDLGLNPRLKSDSTAQNSSEIVFGETSREASVYAYNKMRADYKDGNVTYLICYKNGALAIGAMDEYAFEEAMSLIRSEYVTGGSLTVDKNLEIYVNMTAEEYAAAMLDKNIDKQVNGWNDRWDNAESILGENSVDMLKNLYDCFGEDVYLWLAGLYDTDVGAFYYAGSSLAYKGFAPDVESTCQALKIIYNSGMIKAYGADQATALKMALPEEMQEKLVLFVQSLQSEEDGYFYHEQWGTGIADDRKGRDLQWALQILGWLDAETLYPSAIDRLKDSGAAEAVSKVVAASKVIATATTYPHPDRFGSPESFRAYLEDVMDSNDDGIISAKESYNNGHAVASQSEQIKAAGLLDVACDYFDTLQRDIYNRQVAAGQTPTGLWSDELSFNSISGFFKISVLYSTAKRGINYIDRVVDSAIATILSDEPVEQVVFVYNPWAAMGEAIAGAKNANRLAKAAGEPEPYDMDELYGKVRSKLIPTLTKTIQNSMLFKKEDGGFSYNLATSASKIQGVYASLGLPEGDVNATTLLCSYMINYIWVSLGVDRVDLWSAADFDTFMDVIESNGSVVKIEGDTEYEESFDLLDEGDVPYTVTVDSGADVGTVIDPTGEENRYISMNSVANHADGFRFTPRFTEAASCFSFEADIRVSGKSAGSTHQISFYSSTGRLYMITLKGSTKTVAIGDCSDVSGTGLINGDTGVAFPVDEWFKLGVEIYNGDEDFRAKIYINGECVYISENYIGSHNPDALRAQGTVVNVWVYNLIGPAAVIDMDNVRMAIEDKAFTDSDLGRSTEQFYDFEKYDYKVGGTQNSTDAVIERVTDPTGTNNTTVYHIGKTGTNNWDCYTFKMPTEKGEIISVSMDLYFASMNGTHQIALGTMDKESSYMLGFFSNGNGSITLYEASSNTGSSIVKNNITTLRTEQWYTLTITMTVTDDPEEFEVSVTIGDVKHDSTLCFNLDGTWEEVKTTLDALYMRANKATLLDMYLDNIVIAYE